MSADPEPPRTSLVPVTETPPPQPQQISLDNLLEAAGPLVKEFLDSKEREQQREIDFEAEVLDHETRRFRYGLIAGSGVAAAVLGLAAVLIFRGDAQSARDLIALVVTAMGAWFGGYGMGRRKGDDGRSED